MSHDATTAAASTPSQLSAVGLLPLLVQCSVLQQVQQAFIQQPRWQMGCQHE